MMKHGFISRDTYVNSQNVRMWSAENHIFFNQESQVHPKKIGAWVAISRRRLTTPVFFDVFVTAVRSEEFIIDKMCVYFIKTCR
jgi:hypothetical protein